MYSDDDLARASKRLIVTAERLIAGDDVRHDPAGTAIPYYLVDAVCEVPYGAFPVAMPYEYFSDEDHLREWLTAQNDPATFTEFLKQNILACPDHAAYINRHGGAGKIQELRARELMLHKEERHAGL